MIKTKKIFILSLIIFFCLSQCFSNNIHNFATKGDFEKLKMELSKNPKSINSKNSLGQTPVALASWEGHKEIVKFLIKRGADLNLKDQFGGTPLHMAAMGGHIEIVKLLISEGADINSKSNDGITPFELAFEYGKIKIVEVFFNRGFNVNTRINRFEGTLLHKAVILGNKKLVNFLINREAFLDAKDKRGNTPLELAFICEHKDLADLLITRGAKPPVKESIEVIYIANAGFLISSSGKKFLIDALFKEGFQQYLVLKKDSVTVKKIMNGEIPFNNINFIMFTHNHPDHFNLFLSENYLLNNPDVYLISSHDVSTDFQLYGNNFSKIANQLIIITPELKSSAKLMVNGVKMEIVRLSHGPGRRVQNLGYIVNIGVRKFCHLGDCDLKDNLEVLKKIRLNDHDIDLGFIQYWDFLDAEKREIINKYINPEHIILIHIPTSKVVEVLKEVNKLKDKYPNVTVFKETMEKKVFN